MAMRERRRRNPQDAIRYEVQGLILLGLAGLLALGLAEYLTGFLGSWLTRLANRLFGELVWGVPALAAAAGLHRLIVRRPLSGDRRAPGALIAFAVLLAAWHLYRSPAGVEWENGTRGVGGGIAGALLSLALTKALGRTGGAIALAVAGAVAAVLVSGVSLAALVRSLLLGTWRFLGRVKQDLVDFLYLVGESPEPDAGPSARPADPDRRVPRGHSAEYPPKAGPALGGAPTAAGFPGSGTASPTVGRSGTQPPAQGTGAPDATAAASPGAAGPPDGPRLRAIPGGKARHPATGGPRVADLGGYQLPPLTLLSRGPRLAWRGRTDAEAKAALLEETLSHFGVEARVVHVDRGPTVTRFELQPAQGVRVAKIVSLEDDLALALAARELRIEAPIPGKAAIGIEVPNEEVSPVYLREVLEHPAFASSDSKLTIALGKDISGQPVVADLERLIHLLIAGATGSGKSVCLNAIIASMLFKARPDEVKFLMIDPKVVELNVYDGIPHLLAPLVTDPKKAAGCLRWVVHEMLRRYERFAEAGVRDITRFNLWARGLGPAGAPLEGAAADEGAEPLPYIIVVIDELADLMMVAQAEVEDAIWRLAQMARAAGIHLVVATQRPSVDVLTGTIKANIPSRVAFAVSSQADARTIFDSHGPEKLMGRGDMLFRPTGAARPVRAQGAFISDREVEALVRWVKEQADPRYEDAILSAADDAGATAGPDQEDPLLPDAVRVVMEHQQASASLLQRRLRVGYTRAARLIDMMEERGIVGPHEGSKARQLLMTWEQYQRAMAPRRPPDASGGEAPDGGGPTGGGSPGSGDPFPGGGPPGGGHDDPWRR